MFDAAQASKEGVVRRARADVEKQASVEELVAEVKNKGFHLVEIGDQLVVICQGGDIRIIC